VVVRTTSRELPSLLLLDREQVRVSGGSPLGRVHAWSRERLHVHAASELFASWWDAAQPAFELPEPPAVPLDESDLDVDEWDPRWDQPDAVD
jgi:hypothetical protein